MRVIGAHTMIFGLKGSGKSNFLQWLMSDHAALRNHLIYDICQEHAEQNRYVPSHRRGDEAQAEFAGVLERVVVDNDRAWRPDVVVAEEVSRLAPNRGSTPESLLELIDLNRHYGVGFVGVARRPAQVDTDLVELADNLVIFRLTGKNDHRRLEREVSGLGDAARSLDDYEFLVVDGRRDWTRYRAVPEMDTTGEL